MSLINTLRLLLSCPPEVTLRKGLRLIYRRYQTRRMRLRDRTHPTFTAWAETKSEPWPVYFHSPPLEQLHPFVPDLRKSVADIMEHRFDLLGSGPVAVFHGAECPGLEGIHYPPQARESADPEGLWLVGRINGANVEHARRIWRMIAVPYRPIDWQLDFKSGYRWNEKTWFRDIEYGKTPGADIKVPWELSRMQYLPHLAWGAALSRAGVSGFPAPEALRNEFRNQVLDFIATNPPRFGVNWVCPMDIGIRLVNWLMTRDFFDSLQLPPDPPFDAVLESSVRDHARHILQFLEWNPALRSNHYLSNLAGLLFAAAYLPRSGETDAWLAFSVQELRKEMPLQFHEEGSNFEASTSYHRLSAEIMAFCTGLIHTLPPRKKEALQTYNPRWVPRDPGLDPPPQATYSVGTKHIESVFPESYWARLKTMAHFTRAVSKPDGTVIQIGDNDSGRLVKLHPIRNDTLDHTHLVETLGTLTGNGPGKCLESVILHQRLQQAPLPDLETPSIPCRPSTLEAEEAWQNFETRWESIAPPFKQSLVIPFEGNSIREGLEWEAFPAFGLYLFRSPRLFLALRCGPVGQAGNGGHAHNDALSLELTVDGADWVADPGSYLYTPLPELRNRYRSVSAHFAPQVAGLEPNPVHAGLFMLPDRAQARCHHFSRRGFIGSHSGFGAPVWRRVEILDQGIRIDDLFEGQKPLQPLTAYSPPPFSPGYGKKENRRFPLLDFLRRVDKMENPNTPGA